MVETDDMSLPILPDSHIHRDYFCSPWSYGVQALDRDGHSVVYNLVRKGASFPAKGEREILVEQKSAGKLLVIVVENGNPTEVASVAESTTVGEMEMPIPPGLPKYVKVRIAFELDECGILTVDALVPETNNRQQMKLQKDRDVPPEKIEKTTQRVSQLGLPETQNNASSAMQDKSKKKVYGIDLGTTYSAIAVVNEEGQAEIVPNADGDRKTASAVFFEPSDEPGRPNVVVGKVAKAVSSTDLEHFVDFVKCHMGDSCWKREIEGISWTPEMISAEIIKKLMRDAEAHGEKVNDVVFACPCYYGSPEKQALAVAWRLAGLNVLRTITEPVAVAFHYGLNRAEEPQTAVVYDLGGGTFNVYVVKAVENNIEVVCADGNNRLGGENWTAKIAQYLAEKFAEENGVSADDLLNDPETFVELSLAAEVLKQTLTVRPKATRKVRYNDISSRIEIDRETFDALTKPLLDETEALTEKMMALAAEKGVTKFDEFLLVGGSTRMLQVREMVKRVFGPRIVNEPRMQDVDEAVAKGAAIYGKIMTAAQVATSGSNADSELPSDIPMGKSGDWPPDMIASRSYGVRLSSDNTSTVCNAIIKGELFSVEGKQEFPMPENDAEKLDIQVFANDATGRVASLNGSEEIGEVFMRLPRRRSPDAKVQVKLALSESGVLSLDMAYLMPSPGVPAHVEFYVDSEGHSESEYEPRRESADLIVE